MSITVVEKNMVITAVINNWKLLFEKDITAEQLSIVYTFLYVTSGNFIFVKNYNFEPISRKKYKSVNEGINGFLSNISSSLFEIFDSGDINNLININDQFSNKEYVTDIYFSFSNESHEVNRLAKTNH